MRHKKLKSRFWYKPKALFDPWMRKVDDRILSGWIRMNHFGKFDDFVQKNMNLDWNTKRAALDASPYVVALTSYTGPQRLFICSGTIVNSYGANGHFFATILTSATLLRCPTTEDSMADDIKVDVYLFDRSVCEGEILGYDFHHNVAAIRIKSDVQLQTAVIGNLDDNMECHARFGDTSFHLGRYRDTPTCQRLIKLCPGMAVIALGRYFDDPYHIMAAPGELMAEDSKLDCGELVIACSEITKNGIGGPLINYSGCVIGLNFYSEARTPFLPINIALKCLEHLLNYREVPRPWIGLELSDLDIIELGELEKLIHSSPDTLSGVLVRKVELRSPASDAGICTEDLIIQIDGKHVGSPLEFTSVLLDKAKEPREVIVKRAGSITPLKLTVLPQSAGKLNRLAILLY
ncbi:serine protease Do-like HtrB isoform X2 [Trifolium pratense]|uniref:serine protease Do-like HtrB isoform X2 n=1 Tax=Trifolium pratense TaxID=57577 RepID=UPI001E69675A|nr:serine protease Do-like HtrB isoform X2 [Trifolium pratense]XP_045802057.1 serine protease Do-like HtrB isoform X2 [Trifolium pratense]